MFEFKMSEKYEDQLQADFFYCLFEVNHHFERLINLQKFVILSDYVKEHLIYQLSIKVKDEFLSPILVHEFEISKRAAVLEEGDVLLSFVKMSNTDEWKEYLFRKYEGLENRIASLINNLSEYILFFLEKVAIDKNRLNELFGVSFFDISDILLYQGDFHKNSRFVIQIEFNNDEVLFFKPRDSYNELFFEKIISFFRDKNDINIELPTILTFDEHSWMSKLVYKNNFDSNEQVESYYENLGKLICIFHMLGTADMIPDNLIITNNKIGLFDLEIITTKSLLLKKDSIRGRFSESIKKIGALPEWMVADIELNSVVLSSLFFCLNTQLVQSYVWDKHKFKFDVKDIPFSTNEDRHIPKINNQFIELNSKLLPSLLNGFNLQYEYILQNGEEIKKVIKKNYSSLKKLRVLFHATNIYSQVCTESLVPESYKNENHIPEIIREFVYHFYSDGYDTDKEILCKSIYTQIMDFDIPYFYFDISSKELRDGHGNNLSTWDFSPLDTIIDRIDSFSQDDFNLQLRIINQSCSFALDYFGEHSFKNLPIDQLAIQKEQKCVPAKDLYLKAATKIGDYLIENAVIEKDEINWVSKVRESNGLYSISLLNYDVYDGLSGICLFYIQLYKSTKKNEYKLVFEKIYNELKQTIKNQLSSNYYSNLPKEIKDNYPISPYAFPASFLYLTMQSKELDSKDNWDLVSLILDTLLDLVPKTCQTDYLLGKFGLLDFLLSTKKRFPTIILSKIEFLIDILQDCLSKEAEYNDKQIYWSISDGNKNFNTGGFAHGSSSASYILSKFDPLNKEISENTIFSLNHDRSFFNEDISGWIDNREDANVHNDPVSWCHGSSGIILGRLLMEKNYSDNLFEYEFQIARKNLIEKGLHSNECVCHGSLGNIEVLYALSTRLNDIETKNSIFYYLNVLSEKIINDIKVLRNGVEGNTEILGLFTGLTGAAYQLLRFYDWENTPSILCLETEDYLNEILHEY